MFASPNNAAAWRAGCKQGEEGKVGRRVPALAGTLGEPFRRSPLVSTLVTQMKALAWPGFAKLSLEGPADCPQAPLEAGAAPSPGEGQETKEGVLERVGLGSFAWPKGTDAAQCQ